MVIPCPVISPLSSTNILSGPASGGAALCHLNSIQLNVSFGCSNKKIQCWPDTFIHSISDSMHGIVCTAHDRRGACIIASLQCSKATHPHCIAIACACALTAFSPSSSELVDARIVVPAKSACLLCTASISFPTGSTKCWLSFSCWSVSLHWSDSTSAHSRPNPSATKM